MLVETFDVIFHFLFGMIIHGSEFILNASKGWEWSILQVLFLIFPACLSVGIGKSEPISIFFPNLTLP